MVLNIELIDTFIFGFLLKSFPLCFSTFSSSFSSNSMPCSGCSALQRVNSNFFKKQNSFNNSYKVTGEFLDISIELDKVFHLGVHYKLRQYSASVKLIFFTEQNLKSYEMFSILHRPGLKVEFLKAQFLEN